MAKIDSVIALIKRGATEGERNAAREAYKRLTGREYSFTIRIPNIIDDSEIFKKMNESENKKYDLKGRVKEILRAKGFCFVSFDVINGIPIETYEFNAHNKIIKIVLKDNSAWGLYNQGTYIRSGIGPEELGFYIKQEKENLSYEIHKNKGSS